MLQTDARRVYEVLEQLEKEGFARSVEELAAGAPHRRRRVFSATVRAREMHAAWFAEREPPGRQAAWRVRPSPSEGLSAPAPLKDCPPQPL